jgi:hypothetical protein
MNEHDEFLLKSPPTVGTSALQKKTEKFDGCLPMEQSDGEFFWLVLQGESDFLARVRRRNVRLTD